MKPINEMTLQELAAEIDVYSNRFPHIALVVDRIHELHEQNRWIPVDEALPDNGETVLCRRVDGGMFGSKEIKPQVGTFRNGSFDCVFDWTRVTHWRRIDI